MEIAKFGKLTAIMKKKQSWLLAGLGTIALSVISDNISERTKNVPVVNSIVTIFKWLYTITGTFFNLEIKVYVLLLGVGVLFIVYKLIQAYKKSKEPELPYFHTYTSDRFKQWTWKWQWRLNKGGWEITNPEAFCSQCVVGLVEMYGYINKAAKCPKCQTKFTENNNPMAFDDSYENITDIEQLILAEARKLKK